MPKGPSGEKLSADATGNAAAHPPRFSWDALRVPLNLAWASHAPMLAQPAVQFWADPRHAHHPPAWTDLRNNAIAPYPGHAGVRAVEQASRAALGMQTGTAASVAAAPDYYGAALVLMARLATEAPAERPAVAAPVPTARPEPARIERAFRWLGLAVSSDPAEAAPVELPQFRESRWVRNQYGANNARVAYPR